MLGCGQKRDKVAQIPSRKKKKELAVSAGERLDTNPENTQMILGVQCMVLACSAPLFELSEFLKLSYQWPPAPEDI